MLPAGPRWRAQFFVPATCNPLPLRVEHILHFARWRSGTSMSAHPQTLSLLAPWRIRICLILVAGLWFPAPGVRASCGDHVLYDGPGGNKQAKPAHERSLPPVHTPCHSPQCERGRQPLPLLPPAVEIRLTSENALIATRGSIRDRSSILLATRGERVQPIHRCFPLERPPSRSSACRKRTVRLGRSRRLKPAPLTPRWWSLPSNPRPLVRASRSHTSRYVLE